MKKKIVPRSSVLAEGPVCSATLCYFYLFLFFQGELCPHYLPECVGSVGVQETEEERSVQPSDKSDKKKKKNVFFRLISLPLRLSPLSSSAGLAVHQIITITVSLIMVIAALITTLVLKNW